MNLPDLIDGHRWHPKLPRMPCCRCLPVTRHRDAGTVLLLFLAAVLLQACERRRPAGRGDSVLPYASGMDSVAVRRQLNGWNPAAGPVLLIQGIKRDEAVVLFPSPSDSEAIAQLDSASVSEAPVVLLGRGGLRLSAQLGDPPSDATDDCERWALRDISGAPESTAWSVGFVGGRVAALPLDSVDLLSQRDSMALAAEASRLASSANVSTGPSFQGLRFTVHDVRRFSAAPGVHAMVAHLIRRVNQEANPQEEETLLIAERDSGVTNGPYQLVYAEHASGREEKVATPEVLAALRIGGNPQTSLVVARDNDDGVLYSVIERLGHRRWRVRWTSSITHCG